MNNQFSISRIYFGIYLHKILKQVQDMRNLNRVFLLMLLAILFACSEEQQNAPQAEQKSDINIGGDFELINQNGAAVSNATYADKPKIVFFGFTNCPMVCPTSMATITGSLYELSKDEQNAIYPIFISVDPERDTPEQITEFLKDFHPNFVGLTGTKEQAENIKQKFRVFAKKMEIPLDGNYDMQHSTIIYLFDNDWNYVSHFNHQSTSEEIAAKLKNNL